MGRRYTGKQIKRNAEVKQKNGDVYIYERVYQYDRDKKKTVVIANHLIGKRRAGSAEVEPMGNAAEEKQPQLLLPEAPQPQPAAAAPAIPAPAPRLPSDAPPGRPFTAGDLRAYAERHSCLTQAADLCLPDAQRQQLLTGLWDALTGREMPSESGKVPDLQALQKLVGSAHGLVRTLLRLRVLKHREEELTLIGMGGSDAYVFVRAGGRLLGAEPLPELLSVAAGIDRFWNALEAGDLLLQRAFLDAPADGTEELRDLLQRTLNFVCPLNSRSESARRLLSETSVLRRRSQVFLEEPGAWASTFPLRQGSTLEIADSAAEAELFLHIYTFPTEREDETVRFETVVDKLCVLLNGAAQPGDLNREARNLCRHYLRQDEAGVWHKDPEACRRHEEQLGCLLLIANGERRGREALRLYEEAEHWRRWQKKLAAEGRSLETELMIRFLRDSLLELLRSAAKMPAAAPADLYALTVSEAAAAYLENVTLGELLATLLGPEPDSEAAKDRRTAVSSRLWQAAEA